MPAASPLRPLTAAAILLVAACARPPIAPDARAVPPQEGASRRRLVIPGRGALELSLPVAWALSVEEARPGEEAPPIAFRVTPANGRFTAVIAPAEGPGSPSRARALAERAQQAAAEGSAEKELTLREMTAGGAIVGWWFASTDRELTTRPPSAGEWRALMGGAVAVGGLALTFTLLDDLPGRHRGEFLERLASAVHLPAFVAELPPEPLRGGSQLAVPLPDGWEEVAVTVPGLLVSRPAPEDAGRAAAAWALEPASGLRVALRVAPAGGRATPLDCRERAIARRRGTGDGVSSLVESEADGRPLATFVWGGDTGGLRRHALAWLARGGACVELDLSVALGAGGNAPAGTLELILGSLRFVPTR